jgi:hypothetical protein
MPWRPTTPRGQNVIVRIVQGKPENHRQVWLISAPLMASGAVVGGLVAALIHGGFAVEIFLFSLPLAGVLAVGRGAIESYRLERRRDAAAHSE